MKDLYYGLTLYHILCIVLHKIKFNENKADLIISDLTVDCHLMKKNLEQSGLFENVYLLEDSEALAYRRSTLDLTTKIKSMQNTLWRIMQVSLADYSQIYIGADHFPLGACCAIKGIPYNYFEDGNGQYSVRNQTISTCRDLVIKTLCEKYSLFGAADTVNKRFIDFQAQSKSYVPTDKDIDFSVKNILPLLSETEKKCLFDIFGIQEIKDIPQNAALFLPQHNVNMGAFTLEEQLYQTGLLLDYFADECEIYIKPHPNDPYTDYTQLGRPVQFIPAKFPAELLRLSSQQIKKGVTAWSTSINSLSEMFEQKVSFTAQIDKIYPQIHRYYAVCYLIAQLKRKKTRIYVKGVYLPLLQMMLQHCNDFAFSYDIVELSNAWINYVPSPDNVVVIDDYEDVDIGLSINEPIFFLNSLNKNQFFDGKDFAVYENMISWSIHKELSYQPDFYSTIDLDDEIIWIYTKDKQMKEKIQNVEFVKKLPCTRMVTYNNLADDNFKMPDKNTLYRHIKTLEGILAATQSRLEHVLKEQKHD